MIKKEIREKAGQDFATLMEKENESLGELAIFKKDIIYNLNLLAPENLKDIQKDLTQYLFNDRTVCEVLIEQSLKKLGDNQNMPQLMLNCAVSSLKLLEINSISKPQKRRSQTRNKIHSKSF